MYKKCLSVIFIAMFILASGVFQVVASIENTEFLTTYNQGDVNLDSDVNIKDATLIQKHIANLSVIDDLQISLADVDGKLGVNIKDATHLQKWIAGVEDKLYGAENIIDPTRNPDSSIELPFIPAN